MLQYVSFIKTIWLFKLAICHLRRSLPLAATPPPHTAHSPQAPHGDQIQPGDNVCSACQRLIV